MAVCLPVLAAGCAAPPEAGVSQAPATAPATRPAAPAEAVTELFGPIPLPPDFDAQRARLPLDRIAEAPPSPPSPASPPAVELPRQALRRLEAGRRLFAEHRYTETIDELTTALRYHQAIPEAHRLLAVACQLSGDDKRAREHAEKALLLDPADLICHYVLARLADLDGRQEEALRRYRLALLCPEAEAASGYRALVHYHLGMLLERNRYLAAAAEQWELFRERLSTLDDSQRNIPELATLLRSQAADIRGRLAETYGLLGAFDRAADILAALARDHPQDRQLRAEWIRMLMRARRTDAACEEVSRWVRETRGDKEALNLLVAVHAAAGRKESALALVRELAGLEPDNVDVQLFHVDLLLEERRGDEVEPILRQLAERHPGLPEVHWRLIALQRAREQWDDWLISLAGELAARPDGVSRCVEELNQVPRDRALVLLERGITGEVHAPLKPAIAAARLYLTGRLAARLDRTDLAHRLFEQAYQRDPQFLLARLEMARLRVEVCQWALGLEALADVRSDHPQLRAMIEGLRGRCHDGLDQHEEALGAYGASLETEETAQVLRWRAALLGRMGDRDRALADYERLAALDPDDVAGREELVRALWGRRDQWPRILQEVREMQRLKGQHPATLRCLAMLRLLVPPAVDLIGYAQAMKQLARTFPDDQRTQEELASALVAVRDYDGAEEVLSGLLGKRPCDENLNEILLLVHIRRLEFEKAGELLDRMLAWYPDREKWMQESARLHLLDGRYTEAIALYRRLLERYGGGLLGDRPADIRRLIYQTRLMAAYRRANRADEARALIRQWLEAADPDHEHLGRLRWFALAVESAAGDHQRYLALVRGWLQDDPADPELRAWELGVQGPYPEGSLGAPPGRAGLIGAKLYDEAIERCLAWSQDDPDNDDLTAWLVAVLERAGRHDEAIELISNQLAAAREVQTRVLRLNELREALIRAGQFDAALDAAREAITEVRKLSQEIDAARRPLIEAYVFELRQMLATVMSLAGRHDEAVAHLREMITEVDEERRQAEAAAQTSENPRQREALWLRRQDAARRQVMLLRRLCYVHQRHGQDDLAVDRALEAYELMPDDVALNNDVGYTLADATRHLDRAESMIRYALSESPEQTAYLDSWGWVLYKRGRFAEARTWLLRAAGNEDGDDPVIYDHLGDVYWRLGDRQAAVTAWQRALEIHEDKRLDGTAPDEPRLVEAVRAKLAAVQADSRPPIAVTAAETQPATDAP